MNLMALAAGLLPWAATPASAFTRLYLACSLLSVEAQLVTWLGVGTLDTLVPFNVGFAATCMTWHLFRRDPAWGWLRAVRAGLPTGVLPALVLLVAALNLWRPVVAGDPYELDRILQIERTGTLAYSPDVDPKANFVAAFYELMLADLASIPVAGDWLLRLHGVLGALVLSLALVAVHTWLPVGGAWWPGTLPFVMPVVFHQFVLIKSDLFIGAAALVALAWAVGDRRTSRAIDTLRAGWLAGVVVAAKLTNGAVAVAVALAVWLRQRDARSLVTAAAGLATGIAAGGLLLTFWQNAQAYGDPFATAQVERMGNLNRSAGAVGVGLMRFVLSLVDQAFFTRQLWPGRGGWGGAFGLPLLWALAVLGARARQAIEARAALAAGGLCLLALGVTFPDADLAHRLALGPGLLLVCTAVSVSTHAPAPWMRTSAVTVVVFSVAQILRSAALYLVRV
jgi:hypothetical protein